MIILEFKYTWCNPCYTWCNPCYTRCPSPFCTVSSPSRQAGLRPAGLGQQPSMPRRAGGAGRAVRGRLRGARGGGRENTSFSSSWAEKLQKPMVLHTFWKTCVFRPLRWHFLHPPGGLSGRVLVSTSPSDGWTGRLFPSPGGVSGPVFGRAGPGQARPRPRLGRRVPLTEPIHPLGR